MSICGYHLRCLNYGIKCLECSCQQKTENKDYLQDALNVRFKAKEVVYLAEPDFLNQVI
jgi:hypothetical protein